MSGFGEREGNRVCPNARRDSWGGRMKHPDTSGYCVYEITMFPETATVNVPPVAFN